MITFELKVLDDSIQTNTNIQILLNHSMNLITQGTSSNTEGNKISTNSLDFCRVSKDFSNQKIESNPHKLHQSSSSHFSSIPNVTDVTFLEGVT